MTYLGRAVAVVAWLVGFAWVAASAAKGLRGGPLRLPFRGGSGHVTLSGTGARVAGALYALLGLVLLALPMFMLLDTLQRG